jgi:hypothetical protein
MRRMAWIWFVGTAAWTLDGAIALHRHAWLYAKLALTIAMLFLAAGVFYQKQK